MKTRLLIAFGIIFPVSALFYVFVMGAIGQCDLPLTFCTNFVESELDRDLIDLNPEQLNTPICQNAISNWLDAADKLDPVPENTLIRDELLKQKNDATVTLLNRCDVESLTVEELEKLR